MNEPKRLFRSRTNRMLGGVCAGLGAYLNVDPTVVRLVAVLSLFFTFTTSAFVYLAFWLLVPEEPAA